MKIAITGCAGLIGSWLARELHNDGHEVVGLDSGIGGDLLNVDCPYEFYRVDIGTDRFLDGFKGCAVVYHCAALAYEGLSVFSPRLVANNIIGGSLNIMLAAIRCGVKRVVNCSSMARYGNGGVDSLPTPFKETYPTAPVDPYGIAKVAAEDLMTTLGRVHGVEVVHAVPHNVIGPGQRYWDPYRNVAAIMINRCLQGKAPIIYGDGSQRRCFSFIQDVIPTMIQLGVGPQDVPHGEVFNVGPDTGSVSIGYLAGMICELTGVSTREITYVAQRPCEVQSAYCSSDKIRHWFGFKQETSLLHGLELMIVDIKRRGPRPFDYNLPIELPDSPILPKTWKERLI